jgi:hypothetical protein
MAVERSPPSLFRNNRRDPLLPAFSSERLNIDTSSGLILPSKKKEQFGRLTYVHREAVVTVANEMVGLTIPAHAMAVTSPAVRNKPVGINILEKLLVATT